MFVDLEHVSLIARDEATLVRILGKLFHSVVEKCLVGKQTICWWGVTSYVVPWIVSAARPTLERRVSTLGRCCCLIDTDCTGV